MFTKLKNKASGFTIIEVLIVLAIAGLILLIVFLAVPALQRNSRNTQLRNDAGTVLGYINEYASNNNGSLPGGVCTNTTSGEIWLSADATCTTSAPDQLGGKIRGSVSVTSNTTGTPENNTQEVTIALNRKCNGNNPDTTTVSNRAIAASFLLETAGGSQAQCAES